MPYWITSNTNLFIFTFVVSQMIFAVLFVHELVE
jgi:hypothetical protein